MNRQQDFFSQNHDRLFRIAVWAKYLAWAVLIYYIVRAALVIIQYQVDLDRIYRLTSASLHPVTVSVFDLFRFSPLYYSIDMISDMASAILGGVIYYVVLRGISLGLNMIIETDINYRENSKIGETQ